MYFISVLLGSWRPPFERLHSGVGAVAAKSTQQSCRKRLSWFDVEV
jgi:hypothetical protein